MRPTLDRPWRTQENMSLASDSEALIQAWA